MTTASSFPTLPGCITAGRTLDEARAMAEEALALHLEGLVEDGEAVPEPSPLSEVMSIAENRAAVCDPRYALLRASRKRYGVNVTIPEDVLDTIDRHAEMHGLTRSGFLVRAAERAMREENAA